MGTTKKNVGFLLVAVILCIFGALGATRLARFLKPEKEAPQTKRPDVPKHLFEGWTKPDVVLALTGEQHGYLLPCGCSRPQIGGLERRYNLLEKLKKADWPIVALDLGDVQQTTAPQELSNVQGRLKYVTSMQALAKMKYSAVGVGSHEAQPSLLETLSEYSLTYPDDPRALAANVKDREENYPIMLGDFKVQTIAENKLRVGVGAVIAPSVQKRIKDQDLKLDSVDVTLKRILKGFEQQKADLHVLLCQGSTFEAKQIAKDFPQFHVILCLSDDAEPSSVPYRVGNRIVVSVGHKGRYVGVVGAYRTEEAGNPFELRYQLVQMSEAFMTPENQQGNNPVAELMEKYTKTLKKDNYLAQYGQRKHLMQVADPKVVPNYVGSEQCKSCHGRAYRIWEKSKHAHAYDALVQAKHPSNRQYDGECIVCHTVGFGYESGFRNAEQTPLLKNVGCESCHGPGSAHVADSKNESWHRLMNPWKNEIQMDQFCQRCHDVDNDVHWKFSKRWPEVEH